MGHFKQAGKQVYTCVARGIPSDRQFVVEKFNPSFDTIFAQHNFDLCINCAGSSGVGYSLKEEKKDRILNVTVCQKLLEAIRDRSPTTRLVNFSSAAVYGNPASLPISEDSLAQPISPYGKHKLEAEQLCQAFKISDQIESVNLRVFSVYGPGLKKQLFWDLYNKTLNGEPIQLFGTGCESRDYIFIDDLLKALDCIVQQPSFEMPIINVGNGVENTIQEAATSLLQGLNCTKKLSFNGEVRKGDPINWRADISRLKALGYEPSVSLQEGLNQYAQWLGKI